MKGSRCEDSDRLEEKLESLEKPQNHTSPWKLRKPVEQAKAPLTIAHGKSKSSKVNLLS